MENYLDCINRGGNAYSCGWHYSLAGILNCVKWERKLSSNGEYITLLFPTVMGCDQQSELSVALTSVSWWFTLELCTRINLFCPLSCLCHAFHHSNRKGNQNNLLLLFYSLLYFLCLMFIQCTSQFGCNYCLRTPSFFSLTISSCIVFT